MRVNPSDDGSCKEPKAGEGRHRVLVGDVKKVESDKGAAVIIECEILESSPDPNNVGKTKDQYLGTTGGFASQNEQVLANIASACGVWSELEAQHDPNCSIFEDAVVSHLAQLLPGRVFIIEDALNSKGYLNPVKIEPAGANGSTPAAFQPVAPPMAAPMAAPPMAGQPVAPQDKVPF